MAEPHWISYAGIVTGVIGSISGIAGMVLGIVSYRRTNRIKQMDLRIELRRSVNKVTADLDTLSELLPYADKSRKAVAAATGNSGALVVWTTAHEKDSAIIEPYRQSIKAMDTTYDNLTPEQLEAKLSEAHKLSLGIQKLMDKYRAALASDDKERDRLKDFYSNLGRRG